MSDFVMTYPAFFPLNEHGAPELVDTGEKLCVCLFTDADLVGTFYRDKHGNGAKHAQAIVAHTRVELLQLLPQWRLAFVIGVPLPND